LFGEMTTAIRSRGFGIVEQGRAEVGETRGYCRVESRG
jgi:hypothetical protein